MLQSVRVLDFIDKKVLVDAGSITTITGVRKRQFLVSNPKNIELKKDTWVEVFAPTLRGVLEVLFLCVVPIVSAMVFYSFAADFFNIKETLLLVLALLCIPAVIVLYLIYRRLMPKMEAEILKTVIEPPKKLGCKSGICTCAHL